MKLIQRQNCRRAKGHKKHQEEVRMLWKKPKVVEISCGMEINGYFAARL